MDMVGKMELKYLECISFHKIEKKCCHMVEMKREIKSRACTKSPKGCHLKEREVKTMSNTCMYCPLTQGSECKRHSEEMTPPVYTNLGNRI